MKKDSIGKYKKEQLLEAIGVIKNKVLSLGNLGYATVQDQLEYIKLLSEFPLGCHLIMHRSFSSYWTDYLMSYPNHEDANLHQTKSLNLIETFILKHSLFVNGWKESFQLFQKLMQTKLKDGITLASIPCGEMRDILSLDYSNISHFKILGLDLDFLVVASAKRFCLKTNFSRNIKVIQGDAWQLPYDMKFNLISSCGLNIYEGNRKRNLDLYREFYRVLEPGGILIIGFLTYPPWDSEASEWKLEGVSHQHLVLERTLFSDILNLECKKFRSSDEFKTDLNCVGFGNICLYYDKHCIFPVAIAQKEG